MPPTGPVHPTHNFFHPRLVHFRSQYEQSPGLVLADWRERRTSWAQKTLRCVFYKVRQGRPSPLGMSKLPFELLDMIFRELCGKEVLAVRLVCSDWEKASRPFFAERHLRRSLFWLIGSDLRRLENFARRLGPHLGTMYIATDHFTIAGLRQVLRNYARHRDYLHDLASAVSDHGPPALLRRANPDDEEAETQTSRLGFLARPLRDQGKLGAEYFRHAYQQRRPLSPWKHLRLHSFLWHYLCNIVSQTWLRLTGHDRRWLAKISEMMPHGRLEAAKVSYGAERLNGNVYVHGRPSPGFAAELALLCGKGEGLFDKEYGEHVERVVGKAMEGRGLMFGGGGGG